MRGSIWRWVLLGVLCFSGRFAAADTPAGRPEVVAEGLVQAWNAHDMKAFASFFADDADFVNVAGLRWKGGLTCVAFCAREAC